ncbi:hypothetical protein HY212_03060 [Candidatus Pacearchaeota archaeon]|nr:hypothetical protein [Candidatus Pacearchaeota archaeon]
MTNSRIIIPETFMGAPVKGAIERVLSQKPAAAQIITPTIAPVGKFIYVPETKLYFAKQRAHTNLDWYNTHKALINEGLRMPTIPEFIGYLKYLKENPSAENTQIYNEITQVRDPWRANWLDAYFEQRNDGFYILTHNKTKAEKLEDCLMKDKTPGINLDSWLNDSTSQGLPKQKIDKGDLYYWHYTNGAVAGFGAGSGRASLDCSRGPSGGDPSLGVFAVSESGGNAS